MGKANSIAPQEEVKSAIQDQLSPHPLTIDGWLSYNSPEISRIHTARIADVTRAADGIKTIARLVHNSIGEPDATGAERLGISTEQSLLMALECLGDYIFKQTEDMFETAAMFAGFDRESESSNG